MAKRNIVLIGDDNAGISSIIKIIFQKVAPYHTAVLPKTNKVEMYEFKISKISYNIHDFPFKYSLEEYSEEQKKLLKSACVLIYVLNTQQTDTLKSIERFQRIYEFVKQSNCYFSIFVNKVDIDLQNFDSREEFQLTHNKKLLEEGVEKNAVDFHFTSIHNYSIFEAFSKVLQKTISCSKDVCKLLNTLANFCKIKKIYIFDLQTKLFIANNSDQLMETSKYEICSEIVEVFISMVELHGKNKDTSETDSTSTIKISGNKKSTKQVFLMKILYEGLAIVYIIDEEDYDRPYLVDQNIELFRKGFVQIFEQTIKALEK